MSATVTADAVVERRDVAVSTVPADRPEADGTLWPGAAGSADCCADGLCQAYGRAFSAH